MCSGGRARARAAAGSALVVLALAPPVAAQQQMTVAEVLRDADGDRVPDAVGELVAVSGVLTTHPYTARRVETRASLQDASGGIRLVTESASEMAGLMRGDEVRVIGVVGQYRGTELLEIVTVDRVRAGTPPPPRPITVADLESERFSGQLVRIRGQIGLRYETEIVDDSGRALLYLRNRFFDDPDFAAELVDGREVVVTGIAEQYDGTPPPSGAYRLLVRDFDDVDFAPLPPSGVMTALLLSLVLATLGLLGTWAFYSRERAAGLALALEERSTLFETQRRFVADAGHEIRTPITVLRGRIEVALMQDREPEEYRAVLRRTLHGLDSIHGLADDLLALAKSADGATHRIAIDVPSVLDGIAESFEQEAARAGVQIVVDAPDRLTLLGDVGLVDQAVGNLVDNALKYAAPGGGVRISAAAAPGAVEISVSDRGPGIAEDERRRIFDRFYRGRASAAASGSGLGLAVVHAVMERHGGDVHVVDDEPGARFVLRFPDVYRAEA